MSVDQKTVTIETIRDNRLVSEGELNAVARKPESSGSTLPMEFGDHLASLRSYPYPFKVALAICSDIDETRTVDEFLEIQKFLCTKANTTIGEGIGLEIANSFYFYDDEGDFSLLSSNSRAREIIPDFIRAGYIDCLHSYGDAVKSRDQVKRALDVLASEDCNVDVWVNHYGSQSNLSHKFDYLLGECSGDDPESPIYHADLTIEFGIRFAWVGATTRILGQNARTRNRSTELRRIFDRDFPIRSSLDILKESRKSLVGSLGDRRFVIHRNNELVRPIKLQDGRKLYEFMRYCNHPRGVPYGATSRGLAYVVSERALEALKGSRGCFIVYTHFGKNGGSGELIATETRQALRRLEREYRSGEIYVTTTSKLLNYHTVRQTLEWKCSDVDGRIRIEAERLNDPIFGKAKVSSRELQGITFYVSDVDRCDVYIGGSLIEDLQRNPPDHTGKTSVTIPQTYLSYPR